MSVHPANLMIRVWLVCLGLFLILPFHLITRQVSVYGFLLLLLFVTAFVGGGLLAAPVSKVERVKLEQVDFRWLDRILQPVALIAAGVLLWDLLDRGSLGLTEAFEERNSRASALMAGVDQGGGIFFQIGFLLFPASYVYIARVIAFERRPNLLQLGLFGFIPPLLAALTTGGRGSLLYALAVAALAWLAQRRSLAPRPSVRGAKRNWFLIAAAIAVALVSLNYFVQVFLVRAEVFGGLQNAMDHAALDWGVSFEGPRAKLLVSVLGEGNTYLLFLFAWYVVQGLVISNELLTFYNGPLGYGIYGIDLVTAVVRRVSGEAAAERFYGLLDLNIYGFLPSAFGSLFVDFRFGGVVITFLWGYVAGLVYRLSRSPCNGRAFLAAPFITAGVLFSPLNTPLGFNNGLMTHLWLVMALVASRPVFARAATEDGARAMA